VFHSTFHGACVTRHRTSSVIPPYTLTIYFRTKQFDSSYTDQGLRGGDLAEWLQQRLSGWDASIFEEDWGWAVDGTKGKLNYTFGVYDYELLDVTDEGPLWHVRVFNRRDWSNWLKKLFKYVEPVADPMVVEELLNILRADAQIHDIRVKPLD
jgi:hypothetical protein